MKNFLEIIQSSELFAAISADEITAMLSCLDARKATYQKGEFLLNSGDTTESIGLVLEGNVLIIQEDIWGNRNIYLFHNVSVADGRRRFRTADCIYDQDHEVLFPYHDSLDGKKLSCRSCGLLVRKPGYPNLL